jgi:hypothetical protein
MPPLSCLNTGFFIGTQDKLFIGQKALIPHALIEVQDSSGFSGKLCITREYPSAMSPWSNGILMQPAPYGTTANGGHQTALVSVAGQISRTPHRESGS